MVGITWKHWEAFIKEINEASTKRWGEFMEEKQWKVQANMDCMLDDFTSFLKTFYPLRTMVKILMFLYFLVSANKSCLLLSLMTLKLMPIFQSLPTSFLYSDLTLLSFLSCSDFLPTSTHRNMPLFLSRLSSVQFLDLFLKIISSRKLY